MPNVIIFSRLATSDAMKHARVGAEANIRGGAEGNIRGGAEANIASMPSNECHCHDQERHDYQICLLVRRTKADQRRRISASGRIRIDKTHHWFTSYSLLARVATALE